jgi:hypothetical protein
MREPKWRATEVPRYYFNIYNDELTLDGDGVDLDDDRAALALAVNSARALVAESVMVGHFTRSDRIEILNEQRQVIEVVRFGDAIEVRN